MWKQNENYQGPIFSTLCLNAVFQNLSFSLESQKGASIIVK